MKHIGTYEPVIGLEVHAQLSTRTKAFCSCPTRFGAEPNSSVCPVCLGMPGALPVLNLAVVECAVRMGLATRCAIAPRSIFARKNYFYPDLPKGYQISQYEEPLCTGGAVEIDLDGGGRKTIGITRIHVEEDAGKSIHDLDADTLVDLNRCGVPLLEIVSEPDLRSPREASQYLRRVKQLVTYLGICDGNMEEGSLRCDANVSVRRAGAVTFGTKTEIKNLNSFRNVERALDYEINRQARLIEQGGAVMRETLSWDADRNITLPLRGKEEAHDYRYFPDPDLVPLLIDEPWITLLMGSLPELPEPRRDRFMADFGLPRYDADVLTAEKCVADYFEETLDSLGRDASRGRGHAKAVSNWVMTDVLRVVAERKIAIAEFPVSPVRLAAMIGLIEDGTINGTLAKEVFNGMIRTGEDPRTIVERQGLVQVTDVAAVGKAVDAVMAAHRPQVQKYVDGNDTLFAFFVGETMKIMKGKGNPRVVNDVLRRTLDVLRK